MGEENREIKKTEAKPSDKPYASIVSLDKVVLSVIRSGQTGCWH